MAGPSARRLVLAGLALAALFAGWILATPPGGTPDEAAHLVRGVAAAEGQWHGHEAVGRFAFVGRADAIYGRSFTVPARLNVDPTAYPCFAVPAAVPADCGDGFTVDPGTTAYTYTGGYFPLPYMPLGAAELLGRTPDEAIYLGRAVAALICGGLLLLAAAALRTRTERLAWLAAVLPLTVFTATSPSPGGFEVCGAVAFVAGGLAVSRGRRGIACWSLVIGAGALSTAKFTGPVWLGALAMLLCLGCGLSWLPRLGPLRVGAWALPVAGSAANLWWLVFEARNRVGGHPLPLFTSLTVSQASTQSRNSAQDLFDAFGWLHIVIPTWAWVLALGSLLTLLAALAGTPRQRLVAVAAVATYLVGGFAFAIANISIGYALQTRYVLALAAPVALLLLAAGNPGDDVSAPRRGLTRITVPAAALLALAAGSCGYVVLRDSEVGAVGSWWLHGARWLPPAGTPVTVALLAIGTLLLAGQALARDAYRPDAGTAPAPALPVAVPTG